MPKLISSIIILFLVSASALTDEAHPLVRAYPDTIISVKENTVVFANGTVLPYDDQKDKTFAEKLTGSDIEDMLSQDYPKEFGTPLINHDPGRFRNSDFFHAMYGKTRSEIEENLTTITWMPGISNQKLRVTTINNVHIHLQKVSEELSNLPESFHPYVKQTAQRPLLRNCD